MANDNSSTAIDPIKALQQQSSQVKKSNDAVGKDQFLQLLVTQLKNQDPLNPMENSEFAVDLAQFSSLEQLVDINKKIGGSNDQFSSLAAYLGNQVTLTSDKVEVNNGDGGIAHFELTNPAQDVKVDLLDQDGKAVATKEVGSLGSGKHDVALTGLSAANGEYTIRVSARGLGGNAQTVPAYAAGIVSGFVPGPEPTLLIGNREVNPGDIKEVNVAAAR